MNHQMPLEDRERYEALRSLLENPGWALMREHLEKEIRDWEQFILVDCAPAMLEYHRARVANMKSLLNWPAEQRAAIEGRNKKQEVQG